MSNSTSVRSPKWLTDAAGAAGLVLLAIAVVVLCLSDTDRQRVVAAATVVSAFATLLAVGTVVLALRQIGLQRLALDEQRVQNGLVTYSRIREQYARFLSDAHDVLISISSASDQNPARASLYKRAMAIELEDRDVIRLMIVHRVFEVLSEHSNVEAEGSLLAEHARWFRSVESNVDPIKESQPLPLDARTIRLLQTKGQQAIDAFSATLDVAQINQIRRDVMRMSQRALRASLAASEQRVRADIISESSTDDEYVLG